MNFPMLFESNLVEIMKRQNIFPKLRKPQNMVFCRSETLKSLTLKKINSKVALIFMFSNKATEIDKNLHRTLCSKYKIYGEDFVNFSGLLRKYEF